MYQKYKVGSEMALWCDIQDADETEEAGEDKRKRKHPDSHPSKRQDKEDEVDTIFRELREKHDSDTYETPQLRLWARMIQCGTHDDYDDPPHVPMITGILPKRPKKESITDALTAAATAVAKAFSPLYVYTSQVATASSQMPSIPIVGMSPGKSIELRMKNLQQLRYVQELYEENILSEPEFIEQKQMILDSLRKLTKSYWRYHYVLRLCMQLPDYCAA